jgi:signal transduction histidine kinase
MTRGLGKNSVPASTTASFKPLEDNLRRLRRLLALLLAVIAVLPTSIFISLEISHSRERTRIYARQLALLISHHLEHPNADLTSLLPSLRAEMADNQILFLQLLGDGERLLRLGEPRRQVVILKAKARLSPPVRAIRTVAIQRDMRPLVREAGRVLGIHLFVALSLALLIYAIPMRALRRAIGTVRAAHAQAIHADKLRAIGEAYAGLTHEISNPLSILLTRVKLLIDTPRQPPLPPDLVRDLKVIERHGTRIADILQGLLPFARKTPLEFVSTDLNRVIREAIALVEKPFAAEGVQIEAALDSELPTCLGSPNHLQQVFLNLLNNARDAMPHGGKIIVRTSQTNSHLVAEVQDTGTGIAPQIHERIFEPFFTTKAKGKGTGLGLAVSYGIIADHGGDIEVESKLGEGATFRLVLPLGE